MEEERNRSETGFCQSIFGKCFPFFFRSAERESLINRRSSSASVVVIPLSEMQVGVDVDSSFEKAKQLWDMYKEEEITTIKAQVNDKILLSCYTILYRAIKDEQCVRSQEFLKENFCEELQEALNKKLGLETYSPITSNDFT